MRAPSVIRTAPYRARYLERILTEAYPDRITTRTGNTIRTELTYAEVGEVERAARMN